MRRRDFLKAVSTVAAIPLLPTARDPEIDPWVELVPSLVVQRWKTDTFYLDWVMPRWWVRHNVEALLVIVRSDPIWTGQATRLRVVGHEGFWMSHLEVPMEAEVRVSYAIPSESWTGNWPFWSNLDEPTRRLRLIQEKEKHHADSRARQDPTVHR
jgi:hypothetical protein